MARIGSRTKSPDPFDLTHLRDTWRTLPLPRKVALALIGVVLIGLLIVLTQATLGKIARTGPSGLMATDGGGYAPGEMSERAYSGKGGGVTSQYAVDSAAPSPMPPMEPTVPGDDAEDYEVHSYYAHYETRHLARTCDAIADLKPSAHVVFTHASRQDSSCSFSFKVALAERDAIVSYLESLSPKELTQSTDSVKRQFDDYLDRRTILTNNASSVEAVLEEAIESFDALTALSEREGNADALARSITKKVELIDQLRERREMIRAQIDQLNRAEADLLDRMEYAQFSVTVREEVYVDPDAVADSWRNALQQFVTTVNMIAQTITVGLLVFLLYLVVAAIYGFILLMLVKYGRRIVRRLWDA